jgi:hypothetical protein
MRGFVKPALLVEPRLPIDKLLQLAEAVFDYALTIQAREKWSPPPPPYIILTIPELALRFRKPPQAIKDTLLLLRAMGRAEPLDCREHWKLKLADYVQPALTDARKQSDSIRGHFSTRRTATGH